MTKFMNTENGETKEITLTTWDDDSGKYDCDYSADLLEVGRYPYNDEVQAYALTAEQYEGIEYCIEDLQAEDPELVRL